MKTRDLFNPFKTYTFILLISSLLFACHSKQKTNTSKSVETKKSDNSCLQIKIAEFKKTACANGATIKQFQFQNREVFAFNPGNCGADMTTEIIDSNCESLGFLGGIMGNTKIKGENFSKAELIKIIWESN